MTKAPWWQTDTYDDEHAISEEILKLKIDGPKGIALVKAWPSGQTSEGWGLNPPKGSNEGFMPRYMRGEFDPRRALHGYEKGLFTFAFVMRALQMVCIDIDGKNGGLEHAKKLGTLPVTLAETSKSGDGYHLFYLVDDSWDDELGFGRIGDRIGLEQGVDIRGTGCVYHHKQQRWNGRPPVMLPEHLYEALTARDQKAAANRQRIVDTLDSQDDLEILMMQDELVSELAKPIPVGKRNQTLFAIGSQLHQAQVPDWDDLLQEKGLAEGLDHSEMDKLIRNIERYSGTNAP